MESSAPNRTRPQPQSETSKPHRAGAFSGFSGSQDGAASCCFQGTLKRAGYCPRSPERHPHGAQRPPESHAAWPCLGSCPHTCQRPAQPKEKGGRRIKQRISFLFSCKKHLPSGYKCYCICVALYCCPQLASITGSQWQDFYNP